MHQDVYTLRMLLVALGLLAGFVAVTGRLFEIQISRHEELYEKAKVTYTASATTEGPRGQILDAHANVLAGNMACKDVFAEPRRFEKQRLVLAGFLSRRLGMPRVALTEKFDSAFRRNRPAVEVVLQRGMDIKAAADLQRDLERMRIQGIFFRDSYQRHYPKDRLLANLIGFTDANGAGVCGIEKMQDARLRGTASRAVFERDRRGNAITFTPSTIATPQEGASVYLTIDEAIQQIVETELAAMMAVHQPKAAYAVMANPKTGAILAMAQLPTFNPNERKEMDPISWQNHAIVDGFEPGSIMKCVPITGALDAGVVTLDTIIDCANGLWVFHGKTLRDSGHRYGLLRVWQIVQKSSNIGTAKIAVQMGEKRLYDTLAAFGFGKQTGIGLEDEASGIFRPLAKWDGLSISRFPIGQGILVTPLQMVQAYCALANHGEMPQLTVIDHVQAPQPEIAEATPPRMKGRVASEEAVHQIIQAMTLVTQEGGTAPKAAVEGYEVAGKTGTAQKWLPDEKQYSSKKYVSSFIGFVPADDAAFVLLVVADEPTRNGYYGGTVAAPVFSRIAEKTLRYLQVAPVRSGPRPVTSSATTLSGSESDDLPATEIIP